MAATRIDYKGELAELYSPGAAAGIVDVPELAFLMVDGHGDPNTAVEYREAVEALFAVSYAAKFALKRAPEAVDFAVMPLEGLWWVPDMSTFTAGDKSDWSWTAMIMQPDLVTAEVVDAAVHKSAAKKSLPALDLLRFERFHEGLAAQVMYRGAYADEGPTIAQLHEFIADHGYRPIGKHHEIYLGDPRRSAPEKLRTVIRQPVVAR